MQVTREKAEKLRNDSNHWKFGCMYICSEDPRIIVRNRWFFGWAWNFGNWYTYLVLPLSIILFLIPMMFLYPIFKLSAFSTFILMSTILVVYIVVADYIAKGPRQKYKN